MSALTFIGYIALLALIGFALILGLAIVQLLDAMSEHRHAQAQSVLKHAGLIETNDTEEED